MHGTIFHIAYGDRNFERVERTGCLLWRALSFGEQDSNVSQSPRRIWTVSELAEIRKSRERNLVTFSPNDGENSRNTWILSVLLRESKIKKGNSGLVFSMTESYWLSNSWDTAISLWRQITLSCIFWSCRKDMSALTCVTLPSLLPERDVELSYEIMKYLIIGQ